MSDTPMVLPAVPLMPPFPVGEDADLLEWARILHSSFRDLLTTTSDRIENAIMVGALTDRPDAIGMRQIFVDEKARRVYVDVFSSSAGTASWLEIPDFTGWVPSFAEGITVGDVAGGDYAVIEDDGSIQIFGDGTMWKDMISDLFGKRLNSTSGKVDYDWDENAIEFQSNGSITSANDRIGGNLEINHEFKVGSSITFKPHIHWFQDAATKYELTCRYRLQRNGEAKTTSWTTIVLTASDGDDVWTYPGSGVFNNITRFPDITITCGLSDTFQFQIARTDNLGGSMLVYFLDLHGEVSSFGSRTELEK